MNEKDRDWPPNFERFTYREALGRFGLEGMPKPSDDEVRVVGAPWHVRSDVEIDVDDLDRGWIFQGAWVFLDALTIRAACRTRSSILVPCSSAAGR